MGSTSLRSSEWPPSLDNAAAHRGARVLSRWPKQFCLLIVFAQCYEEKRQSRVNGRALEQLSVRLSVVICLFDLGDAVTEVPWHSRWKQPLTPSRACWTGSNTAQSAQHLAFSFLCCLP